MAKIPYSILSAFRQSLMGMSRAASRATQHSCQHPTPSAKGKTKVLRSTCLFWVWVGLVFLLSVRKLYPLCSQGLAFRVTIQEQFTDDKTGCYRAFQQVNYLISSRIPALKRLRSEALNVVKCCVKFSRCSVCVY